MKNIDSLVDFLAKLKEQENTSTVSNPYRATGPLNKLKAYLEAMLAIKGKRILLVGEAPGYKGCGITGIPFTSGRMFEEIEHPILNKINLQIVWLCVLILGCLLPQTSSGVSSPENTPVKQHTKPHTLTVILDWFPNPDHAPIFVAKQQGYFKQQGLDVTLIGPADPDDPPKLVAAGKADIAVTYQPQFILQQQAGLPLTQVGTLVATPLNTLVVLKDGPIKSIKDLKGKTIGSSITGADNIMLKAMLASAGMTMEDVTLVNVHYDLTQALLTKKVDAVSGIFRNYELLQLALAGHPGRAFYPEEYGIPPYSE